MAEFIIKMPDVGEGVAEAELVEWHVKPGDPVREDMVLAAVMTDKATVEMVSYVGSAPRSATRLPSRRRCCALRSQVMAMVMETRRTAEPMHPRWQALRRRRLVRSKISPMLW